MENLVTRGETPRGRVDNQQTQQTLRVEYGTRTQAKLVKDESTVILTNVNWSRGSCKIQFNILSLFFVRKYIFLLKND